MADHTATFAMNLEDGTSAPALKAKAALQQLQTQLAADTKALSQMQRAMKNLKGGTSMNVEEYRKLDAAIKAKKASMAQGTSSILALGGSLDATKPKATKVTSLFEQLTQQVNAMPGPLAGMTSQFQALGGLLAGGAIALGIIAITAALVALTAATIAAVVGLTRYGIAQADAARSEALRLEGLTKLRFWYKAAAGSASELQSTIDKVSANSALGRGEIAKYTEQLYRMGLRGQNLSDALEGVAIKASTQGSAAANAFAGMAAGAALSGRSVKAMADTVKARLGGIAARQMLALSVQTEKLKESFDALFRDINLEGFLAGLREVTSLFSQNTVTGRVLKSLLEKVLQPLINAVAAAGPYVKRFFQGMLLAAFRFGTAILRVRRWLKETFGESNLFSGLDGMNIALRLGQALVIGLAFAFAMLAGFLLLVTAPIWATIRGFLALYKLIKSVVSYLWNIDWGAIGGAIKLLFAEWGDILSGIDWGGLGASIIEGIVAGLKLAAGAILNPAILGVAEGAWNLFKGALGIASPSKEFAKLGVAIPQGVAAGVEQGSSASDKAVAGLVEAPGAGGAGAARGGPALTIGELHVHAQSSDAKGLADEIRFELERVLEGLAVSLGAPVPGVG